MIGGRSVLPTLLAAGMLLGADGEGAGWAPHGGRRPSDLSAKRRKARKRRNKTARKARRGNRSR